MSVAMLHPARDARLLPIYTSFPRHREGAFSEPGARQHGSLWQSLAKVGRVLFARLAQHMLVYRGEYVGRGQAREEAVGPEGPAHGAFAIHDDGCGGGGVAAAWG